MSCNDYDKLNDNLKSIIKFTIEFTVPSENERLEIFKFLINNEKIKLSPKISILILSQSEKILILKPCVTICWFNSTRFDIYH